MKGLFACASALLLLSLSQLANATDPISTGYVSQITHRNGYVMFKVATANGTNRCLACPPDPGNFEVGGFCWIEDTDRASFSAILLAKAQGLMISGRVVDMPTNCKMNQMTVRD